MLLGSVLADRRIRFTSIAAGNVFALPNEVLQEVPLVLGEEQDLRLLDDIAEVFNQMLAFAGEPAVRLGECWRVERRV